MKKISLIGIYLLVMFIKASQAQVVLQRCDRTNLWSGSNVLAVDKDDVKEGSGSLQFTGSGVNWFVKKFSQTYSGLDETGYLSLWLYISNPANIVGEGSIEISSSGMADTDEYSWDLGSIDLSSGWNKLILPISSAIKLGNPNLNAISYFRVYQNLSAPITAKIDDIRFLRTENPETSIDPLDIKPLDFNSLDGKVMFGYQGWFLHPDDGSAYSRWRHWGGSMSSTEDLTVDMFPDFREYEADELYLTGNNFFSYPDGRPVRVYSAYTKKTVMRHMKWIRDYGLDGVFLQRFISNTRDESLRRSRDTVTANIMNGCEKYGRTFANMWDLSGFTPGDMDWLIDDWKHLVDDLKITDSPNYLHHRGLPLVSIWGFTVREEFPESDLQKLLDFFKGESTPERYRASVMLGVDHDFHERSSWLDELSQADVISPWAVGRFSDDNGQQNFMNEHVLPAQDWCDRNNVDFLPVIWPGFSWHNLKGDTKNKRPRRGGNFFWTQATRVISGNAKSIYIAMFDEIDESTAMYKLAENASQAPDQGYWLTLDADGYKLPSDWYLRCAKQATEIVRGNMDNQSELGTPPDGIDDFSVKTISAGCGASNGQLRLSYPLTTNENLYEFSIDGGNNFSYSAVASSKEIVVKDLAPGTYNVWVRNEDGSYPTDLGPYTIFNADPSARVNSRGPTCSEEGIIYFLINDLPYAGEIQMSIDSGQNYIYTSEEGVWKDTIHNLEAGTYNIWIRYDDETCPRFLETETFNTRVKPIEVFPMIDGVQLQEAAGDTVFACPGSSLFLFCMPNNPDLNWKITGPNDFYSNSRAVEVSNSLNINMFGTYSINYKNSEGCDLSTIFELALGEECEVNKANNLPGQTNLKLYPNPAVDYLLIENHSNKLLHLDIRDLSGRQMQNQLTILTGDNRLDLSVLKSGLYVLNFLDVHGISYKRSILTITDN